MESIKTSKKAEHYCRLHHSGALYHRCENQCKDCQNNINQNINYEVNRNI